MFSRMKSKKVHVISTEFRGQFKVLRYCSLVVLIIMVNLRSPFEEEIPALTNVCHTISKKTLSITNIPFANCLKWKEMLAKTEHETSRNGILKLVCLRKFSSARHIHVTYREAHSAFSRLWRAPPLFFPCFRSSPNFLSLNYQPHVKQIQSLLPRCSIAEKSSIFT